MIWAPGVSRGVCFIGSLLVLPGQGLLTILIALVLLSFPGKYRLERRLFMVPTVRNTVNWLRRRAERPPLIFDGEA
nr:hypothetical protein [Oceanimonas sp. MB9]